jgi:hypothetical protein
LSEKEISSFELTDSNGKVRIQRKGDVWILGSASVASTTPANPMMNTTSTNNLSSTEFQADSASVISILEKIVAIKRDQLISTNPQKQSLFEVDSAKGILAEVFDQSGKSRGSIRIGKNGPDYSSCYVRMPGSNEVYMVGGNIKYSFFTDNKRWRDKSVIKFDQSTAKSLSIMKKDGSKIVLNKDSTTWKLAEPIQAPVKATETQEILSSLSRLMAADIDSISLEDTATGFANPELAIAITFSNGTIKNIVFGSKNSANQYHLKADGKSHVYLVGEYEFNKFNITADKLKEEPAPVADTTKAVSATPMPLIKSK